MKYLLAPEQTKLLARYAKSRVVLAFDFDGTLAPIVSDPTAARLRANTRLLLQELSRLYPCVVISGRSRADTLRKTRSIALVEVFGNHGLEPGNVTRYAKQVAVILPQLRRQLRSIVGIDIENKRLSVSVHYRRVHDKRIALAAIRAAIAGLAVPLRVIPGKQVVNLLPKGAPGKGQALSNVRRKLRVDRAVYVGDDITDEDVFSSRQRSLLSIRIGQSRSSAAGYFLRNQGEIDRLLKQLIALRCAVA